MAAQPVHCRATGWIPLSVWQDQDLASAARLGIYELRHIPGSPNRPVLVTSISESQATLRSLITELSTSYGLSVPNPREDFQVVSPDDLAGEPARSVLADPRYMSVSRRIPVRHEKDAFSFLTPLDLPAPEAAEHLPTDVQWQVDVVMPGRQLPARPAIRGSALSQVPPGGIPDAIVRAGRHGVSFSSANMGFVLAGGPPESRRAHPMLRFLSAEQVFIESAAARGKTIQRSDAGRRAANATELWGSFEGIIADLGGPARRLLDAPVHVCGASGDECRERAQDRRRSGPPVSNAVAGGSDLYAEVAWLTGVSQAFATSPIITATLATLESCARPQ